MKEKKNKDLTKQEQIDRVMKKYIFQRKFYLAGLISVIASMVVMVGGILVAAPTAFIHGNNLINRDRKIENVAKGLPDYQVYINEKTAQLYTKLQNGEITPNQFSEMYSDLISDEKTLEWARASDNAEIQEIVKQYDGKVQKAKNVAVAGLNAILGGTVATIGFGVCGGIMEKVSDRTLEQYKKLTAKAEDEKEA